MIRGILLVSLLVLCASGAYLYQQIRFVAAAGPEISPAVTRAGTRQVILEVGGGMPVVGKSAGTQVPADGGETAPPAENPPREPGPTARPTETTPTGRPDAPPVSAPAPPTAPESPSVFIQKGETLYSIAVKHYGSGAPAVRKDIIAASRIADESKIREGTRIVLPLTAGGRKRQ